MPSGRLAACAAFAISSLCWAEEPVALPPVHVPVPDAPAREPSAEERDPTGATFVIDVEASRGEGKDTAALLAPVPGVKLEDLGGFGQAKGVSIRAASAQGVLVLLDGLPLAGPGGLTDLSLIPAAVLGKLEVTRGALGSRYGSSALGGVVNLRSRAFSRGLLSAELSYGSFQTATAEVNAADQLFGGDALAVLHGGTSRGDFTFRWDPTPQLTTDPLESRVRENNQATQGGALLKYSRRLAPAVQADALLQLAATRRGIAGTVEAPTASASEQDLQGAAILQLRRVAETGPEWSARAFLRRQDSRFSGAFFAGGIEQQHTHAGTDAEGALLLGVHRLVGAAGVSHEGLEEGTGRNPSWWRWHAALTEEALVTDSLLLTASVRGDRIGPHGGVTGRLGAAWAQGPLELRANLGSAWRVPSFLELYLVQGRVVPNPNLRPERSYGADLLAQLKLDHLLLGAGVFFQRYHDLITYEYYPPLLARPENFEGARAYGAELEGALELERMALKASYTLLFSENLIGDPRLVGLELPYRPRHRVHARLSGGVPRVRGHLEADLQSSQFTNRRNTTSLPARLFLSAGASVLLLPAPQLRLSVELKNLLDSHTQDFDGYPLPGRSLFFTLGISTERSP